MRSPNLKKKKKKKKEGGSVRKGGNLPSTRAGRIG